MTRPRLRTRLIAAILSPVLFFGLLEGALRIAGYRYLPGVSGSQEEARRLPPSLYARDPVLLWTLPRSAVLDNRAAGFPRVRTNRAGLRGRELPGDRRPREFRVLCLGDSVTFCMGVVDGRTWPEQLERVLAGSPELAGRPVHVLNGGVPGWSSVQGMRLLARLSWYEPDIVVFWFGINDAQPAWGRPDAEKGGEPGALYEATSFLGGLRTLQLVANAFDAVGGGGEYALRASIEDYAEAVERLSAFEAGGGSKVIFVRYPDRLDATIGQFEEVVSRAEAEGVGWVAGPAPLLLSITPAPDGVLRTGRVAKGPEGSELRYGPVVDIRSPLAEVRDDFEYLLALKRAITARRALLPGDAPGFAELFGDAPPAAVFSDNVHLSAGGCRLAAEGIAARILAR